MSKFSRAVVVAMLLSAGLLVTERTMSVLVNPCATLTPDNWFLYWFWGCAKDATGGGGSGAGSL